MKKISLKRALSIVLAVTCLLCFTACDVSNDVADRLLDALKSHMSYDAAGTYKFKTMEMEGLSFDIDALMSTAGMDAASVKMELVLGKDGRFELNVDALGEGASEKGTYKVSGSTLTMTANGSDLVATIKNGVITIEEEGITMTFER